MIKIQINYGNEKFLDSQENLSFSVELNNPIFGTVGDSIKSYSYPFTLPRTPNNDILLEFPTFINNPKKWIAKKATVFVDGIIVIEGDLVIMGATNNSVSIAIQVNQKIDWISTRKMTDLKEMGYVWQRLTPNWYVDLRLPETRNGVNEFNQKIELDINGIKYSTIISSNNVAIRAQALINLRNQINADTANNNAIAIIITGSIYSDFRVSRVNNSLPFYVIPTATTEDHFYIFQYAVEDTVNHDIRTKEFIDTVMSNTASYIFRYPELIMMSNADNLDTFGMNHHENGEYSIIDDLSITSPQILVKKGLELLLATFGYKLQSNFLNESDLQEMFFANNHSNAPQNYLGDLANVERLRFYPEYFFFYCEKFPDKTLLAWLEDFAKMFCLYVQFDHKQKTLTIESINTVMVGSNIKEYECNENYSIDKKEVDKKGYKFSLATPTPTSPYKEKFETYNKSYYADLTVQDGAVSVKTNISFLSRMQGIPDTTNIEPAFFGGWWNSTKNYDKIPYFQQGTSSRFYGERGNAKRANALMFYQGFFLGKTITDWSAGNETLQWGVVDATNTFGLYNRRWRRFVNFMNSTEPVKRKIYMYLKDFANLDLSQKIRVDNQTYFIKKARVQFSHSTKLKIVVECDLLVV